MAATRLSSPQQFILALNGKPVYIGTIAASTVSANLTVPSGTLLLLQPDVDCFVSVSTTAVASSSLKVKADDTLTVLVGSADTKVSAITATGTANVKVFSLS